MKVTYSDIGSDFQVRFAIRDLDGRAKVNLCRQLFDDLGIAQAMSAEPDATARAQEIITVMWDRAWSSKEGAQC